MRVLLDEMKCSSLGMCEAVAPEFFEIGDDGALAVLRSEADDDARALLEEAVAACPTAALRLEG